jgi:hypothetical protein
MKSPVAPDPQFIEVRHLDHLVGLCCGSWLSRIYLMP